MQTTAVNLAFPSCKLGLLGVIISSKHLPLVERFPLLVFETQNGHSDLLDLTSNYFEGCTFVDDDVGNIKMDL